MTTTPDYCRSIVRSSARTIEERDLLGAIVDAPLDPTPRANYLEWLRERGDKLESLVEVLSHAVAEICDASSDKPPEFWFWRLKSGYPEAWLNMLGVPLFEMVARNAHSWALRDLVFKYANPRLGITAEAVGIDQLPVDGSRFGGRAALPAGTEWPTCTKGPLTFIAQIALSEIQTTQVARFLPSDGWLSFFALNEHVGGNYDDCDFRVVYTPGSEVLAFRDPPMAPEFGQYQSCRLIFMESWDLPEGDVVISEEDQQRLSRSWSDHGVDFATLRNSLGTFDGHLLGDLRHSSTDHVARSPTDRNLICFSSIASPGWNWCDGGDLSIFIEHDDLMALRFGNAGGYAA